MICPVCKESIEDNTLICPHCYKHIATMAQTAQVEKAKSALKGNIKEIFSSKSFLNLCIVMSVITVLFAVNILISLIDVSSAVDIIGIILYPGFLIFTAITTAISWKFYASKSVPIKKMKGLSAFPAFFKVIFIIFTIIIAIIGTIILIFSVISIIEAIDSPKSANGLLNLMEAFGMEDLVWGTGPAPLIIFTVIFFLLLAATLYAIVRAAATYLLIEFFYKEFATIYNSGEFEHSYDPEKKKVCFPISNLYVLGGIISTLAIVSFIFVSITLGIVMVCTTLYLIFSAIFFKQAEKILQADKEKCDIEAEKLAKITAETKKQQVDIDRKLREERRAELKREAEEEKRKQAEAAEREELRKQLLLRETMRAMLAEEKEKGEGENV